MATFPTKAPEAPEAFDHGSGFHGTQEAPPVIPLGKAPAAPPKKAPQSGTHPKTNPGSTVYDSSKAGGRMIRVSRILTRYQDLTVEEDEPGDSSLLK